MASVQAAELTLVHHDDTTTTLNDVKYELHRLGVYVEENGKPGRNYGSHEVLRAEAKPSGR
jgi:hypothetical protein